MKYLPLLIASTLLLSFTAQAIVIRHDKDIKQYHVDQSKYPSVVDLDFLTGTLISPQWILTAAHGVSYMPGGQRVTIGKEKYRVRHLIVHPEFKEQNLSHDMMLLKLDRPVTGVKSTGIYTLKNEVKKHVWFVGRGDIGNGIDGIIKRSKNLHHAENIIESAEPHWITFDFDNPKGGALPLEGISGPGDSGGPAFINTPQGLKTAGVSSHQRNNNNGEGKYNVHEYYSRTSTHAEWILSTMQKSSVELAKISVPRVIYKAQPVHIDDINSVIGTYELTTGEKLFVSQCEENICYHWANTPLQIIHKGSENLWFHPRVNRVIKWLPQIDDQALQLSIDDFNGKRIATKI